MEAARHRNTAEERPRILIVDDDPATLRAMELMLQKEFAVTKAGSGTEAVDLIRKGTAFEVVSLDLQMPGISGVDALRTIKQLSPSTEVMLVTGFLNIDAAKQAIRSGAYDYVEKPITRKILVAAIKRGVARRLKTADSERTRKQLEVVKAKLVHTERLSAIGAMLAGVIHEINNPLGIIKGYSELLLMSEHAPEEDRKKVEQIVEAAKRCQNITSAILDFARKKAPKPERVNVNDVLDRMLTLKSIDLTKNRIAVDRNFAENLPDVCADANQIHHVFLKIVTNAQHAMKVQERPKLLGLKTRAQESRVRVYIKDNGPGIPKENLRQIFEPFFTTKERGNGTGLGLSVCYDLVKDHRGEVYISSEVGTGACFVIELPVQDASKA